MPQRPKQHTPQGQGTRADQRRQYDRQRDTQPYRQWYKTARWQKLRLSHLISEPLCIKCKAAGRYTIATVADHIEPHRGDETLFWASTNLQSMCPTHHNSDKQREENGSAPRHEIGPDGWPIT